jgi:acetylglutamate kinase
MEALRPAVVKIGGALIEDGDLSGFWNGIRAMMQDGPVVVVHGAGPQATHMARRMGHEPRMVHGRRVTGDLDLDIMLWVARGAVNTRLVAQARRHGIDAIGLSGVDAALIRVDRRPPWTVDGELVDFGWVGDIRSVDPAVLDPLTSHGLLPIVAPLAGDDEGHVYNVNADTIAMSLAVAVAARRLVLVTDSGGLRTGSGASDHLVEVCDPERFEAGVRDGWIQGGMRVKLQVGFEALRDGVAEAWIAGPDDLGNVASATRLEVPR